jgi:hypothetical protein
MVVTGNSLHTRVCAFRGVVQFSGMGNDVIAQIDPNLRDPDLKPLCFPIASLVFVAGVVADENSPISKAVAVQIEPHGTMRIVGGGVAKKQNVKVRLDGITFTPFMTFNTQPNSGCSPNCFPQSTSGVAKEMGISGCLKYCTPPEYGLKKDGSIGPIDCQCDMVKRIECFARKGLPASSNLKCGQFKQLIATRTLSGASPDKCGEVCGRQLALL